MRTPRRVVVVVVASGVGWADRKATRRKCRRSIAAVVVCQCRCSGSVVVVVVFWCCRGGVITVAVVAGASGPDSVRQRDRLGGGRWVHESGWTRCQANRLGRRLSVDRSGGVVT